MGNYYIRIHWWVVGSHHSANSLGRNSHSSPIGCITTIVRKCRETKGDNSQKGEKIEEKQQC